MEVWHVRHGERSDEVSGIERLTWKSSAIYKAGRYYDPPLTNHGRVQARIAGLYLSQIPFNQSSKQEQWGFDIIYTSPLQRAVQTAVCISEKLGNLPLQVVPGLCSCTAALVRIGYEQATVMTDADIAAAFPEVNLLPRDPLASTSFRGAREWLAARPNRRRVLVVGHREGTKDMAGRKVPTPHCCIAIFRVDRAEKTYELHDLLSHNGKALLPDLSSKYRKSLVSKKVPSKKSGSKRIAYAPAAAETRRGVQPRSPTGRESAAFAGSAETSSSELRGSGRRLHGAAPSTSGRGEGGGKTSSGASRPKIQSQQGLVKKAALKTGQGKGKGCGSGSSQAMGRQRGRVPTANEDQNELPLQSKEDSYRHTNFAGTSAGGVPAPNDACAGHGFRVAVLGRRFASKGSPNVEGLLQVPVDTIFGSSGVLSFLRPAELCTAQATCKVMATVAASEHLWTAIYSQLPKRLRDQTGGSLNADQIETPTMEDRVHPKTLFTRALYIALASRARQTAHKVSIVRQRLGVIHGLRGSVDSLKTNFTVRLNGALASVVDSRGTRAEAWVSRVNVLSEPSIRRGLRRFSLGSSVKVELSATLADSLQLLRSMSVAFSLPEAWLPRVAFICIDRPLLSQALLLGKSIDNTVTLFDVSRIHTSHSCLRVEGEDTSGGDTSIFPPAPRACALLGVLESHDVEQEASEGGIAFLTLHFPHELLLKAATRQLATEGRNMPNGHRRRSKSYSDDLADPKHGLKNFAVALSLRTAGVPVWETASVGVDGHLCPRYVISRSQSFVDGDNDRTVVRVALVRPGGSTEHALSSGPGLPYSTSGGLSGVVKDVLLADFALWDPDGDSLWAFTSPIVFEPSTPWLGTGSDDGNTDNTIFDMKHEEVRNRRRRGFVEEPGVGRVIVELALVTENDGDGFEPRMPASQRQLCPAGHAWMVRVACVEFELGFVNAWFGTKHGRT